MSRKKYSAARNAALSIFILSLASPLSAVASSHISEIVVSVRKIDENVQEIPVQATIFGEQTIEQERIRSLADVAELTPSIQFDTGFWPSDTRVSIRGLFNRAGRPSAAVLIDGIDAMSESMESAGGSALLNQRILDIERIEVARGPQSALYGRGAFSGAINYVTRRPPDEWESTLLVDGASRGSESEFQFRTGGPLIDGKLNFNVMLSDYETHGYYKNPNTDQYVGGGESRGGALAFEWLAADNVSVYWNTTYSDDDFEPQAIAAIKPNKFRVALNDGADNITLIEDGDPDTVTGDCLNPGSGPGLDACLWVVNGTIGDADDYAINVSPDPRTGGNYRGTDDETARHNLIIEWDINEDYAFRWASSYTDSNQFVNMDTDQQAGLPPPAPWFSQSGNDSDGLFVFDFRQRFHEVQISFDDGGKVNWLAGLNLFDEDGDNVNRSRFWYRDLAGAVCTFTTAACTFEEALIFNKRFERDTNSVSAFGLVGIALTDNVKLTMEGRWIHDKIEVKANTSDSTSDSLGFPFFSYAGSPGFKADTDDTNFVPRASLDWFVTDDVMLYTSIAKGIKPPTYNTTNMVDPETSKVKKEKLTTYEVGMKSTLDEGRVILNGAIFFNDYEDQQVLVQFPGVPLPRSGTANAGETEVWGLELDTTWRPDENWTFNASYAYIDGEYKDFVLADAQAPGVPVSGSNQAKAASKDGDFSGNQTVGVPEHAFAFLGRYQAPIFGDTDWYTQLTASWQDERWADVSNLAQLDSYWMVNGQVGLESEDWFLSLYVENLRDDDTIIFAQEFIDQQQGFQLGSTVTFPVAYYAYLPQPRTVGFKFQYKIK
ncbi:MAG: TonB-dependent receptor [Gammaproteobacteria bacterium]|jgi:outer membrane receptor protein involved in Fe transport|nr:TonB-dependent receptor [Gammaproteobacteria bacterium]MDP6616711.1 TonB-dependent receptor [Gammaproteobacteria bacterium]MDP6695224.1 TonB-dependent receptor [Gammaproteobacteria bacterium]